MTSWRRKPAEDGDDERAGEPICWERVQHQAGACPARTKPRNRATQRGPERMDGEALIELEPCDDRSR